MDGEKGINVNLTSLAYAGLDQNVNPWLTWLTYFRIVCTVQNGWKERYNASFRVI